MRKLLHPLPWTLLGLLLPLNGCRTTALLPPMNLSESGWKVHAGQAVWQTSRAAPEIAGDIVVASHPDGRAWIQFMKTPLPLVTAQMTSRKWQIEFIPEKHIFTGVDQPPVRFLWLHLLRALRGVGPSEPLQFRQDADGSWRLENKANGEILSGYLNP